MKRYVLGNLELSGYEISLLKELIFNKIKENNDCLDIGFSSQVEKIFENENKHLQLMFDELNFK